MKMKKVIFVIICIFILSINFTITGCASPPKEFMELKIWANMITDCKTSVTLGEFINQLVKGSWEKSNADQWIYRCTTVDPLTKKKHKIVMLFKKDEPPNPYRAYTGGFDNKEMAEHIYRDCFNVRIVRMLVDEAEMDSDWINKFIFQVANPVLK